MPRSPWDYTELYHNAIERLDCLSQYKHSASDVAMYLWLQLWPNSGCGFGGLVCHSFTEAQTLVAVSQLNDTALIYHNNRFAYRVLKPTKTFWDDCRDHRLAGAGKKDKQRRKQYNEN